MNVSFKNNDSKSGVLNIKLTKEDYQGNVDKALKEYKNKANIPGFRTGTAPMALIKKQFGKAVLSEEISKLAHEAVYNYIKENKLNVLGEPMPNPDQKPIDLDNDVEFDLSFDIALSPEISIELSKDDKLKYYNIDVDQEMIDKQIESFCANYGSYKVLQEDAKPTDMIKGTIVELENGEEKEGGIKVENGVLMASYMKDKDQESKFEGAKADDVIIFNPWIAYEGNEVELSSLLAIKKEEVPTVEGKDFKFTVLNISRYEKSEIGQDLFDKVFGKDSVKSEDEFIAKIKENLAGQIKPESDYKFMLDASQLLLDKAGAIEFPSELLQRWLTTVDEKNTPERLKDEYPKIEQDLKFHLIKSSLAKKANIKIDQSDIIAVAKDAARAQFAQYGMTTVPEEMVENYATRMLENEQMKTNLEAKVIESKVIEYVKTLISVEEVVVTLPEFQKMFEEETENVEINK